MTEQHDATAVSERKSGEAEAGSNQLAGLRIAVTADRRSEDLISALERRGATVMHAPTIRLAKAPDDGAVERATQDIIDAEPDLLLVTTSYGLKRWFEAAEKADQLEPLKAVLAEADILVRGPKARGGVRGAGLNDVGMSEQETTASMVDLALSRGVDGQTVVLQLHGDPGDDDVARLEAGGARVITVAPYGWRGQEETVAVRELIDAICNRQLDAITFTSAPAVDALFGAADAQGLLDDVQKAMRTHVRSAAVGPVTAAPLIEAGIEPIIPE